MTITELRSLGGERCLIGLSDGGEIRTTAALVAEMRLFRGKELSADELCDLRAAARLAAAKERAMRIISARPMSEMELYTRLVEKGETEQDAAECVACLVRLGFLKDGDYAAMVVRHYAARGYGRRRVQNELYRRKIPREMWDEALSQMPEQDDTVYRLLCSRIKSAEPDRAELRRAADYLQRRGYSWDEIRAAIARYQSDSGEEQ